MFEKRVYYIKKQNYSFDYSIDFRNLIDQMFKKYSSK